jgi:hypothetical protein
VRWFVDGTGSQPCSVVAFVLPLLHIHFTSVIHLLLFVTFILPGLCRSYFEPLDASRVTCSSYCMLFIPCLPFNASL